MMEHLKNGLLISSLAVNAVVVVFVLILTQTSYLDVPLAAYSHKKNCEQDFDQVLKQADKLPGENQTQAKQLYASVVCQKDAVTGRALTGDDFTKALKQLQGQVGMPSEEQ
jgi:hypothetical protein